MTSKTQSKTQVSKHIPNKKCLKRKLKYRSKLRINSKIKKLMKIRGRLSRKWRHSKSDSTFNVYKKFRKRVTNELKKDKEKFFQYYFMEKNSMKKLWHGIKSIISKNSSFSSIDKITDKNGNLTSNPFEISSVFTVFFITVSHEITRSLPKTNESPIEYLHHRNPNSICLSIKVN